MKETLEKIFDIPFLVENGVDSYPWVRITPKGEKGQMFSIKVVNRADVRLVIDFEPQTFSAALVSSMGRSDGEKRAVFCDSVRLQMARGGDVSMKINGIPVVPYDSSTWPSAEWKRIEFQTIVILPADIAGEARQVKEKMREWGCLAMGTFLSLVRIDSVERNPLVDPSLPMLQTEGDRFSVVVNKYERSTVNRFLCIARYGVACSVCGFDFKKKYGAMGDGFIHVHHVIPISKLGPGYVIDPEKDLIPVCPNCHAMLHRKDPPYMPEELRQIINRERQAYDCLALGSGCSMVAENDEGCGEDK
ncbi:MAG: HNH endonuclease [Fibrobacterales bacterium]|nr:HNH endonuclease [Fibrobacterales bacterium]